MLSKIFFYGNWTFLVNFLSVVHYELILWYHSLLKRIFTCQEMSLLEVKHGLLQIAESLDFLHNNARLIHRAISPEVTIVCFHNI